MDMSYVVALVAPETEHAVILAADAMAEILDAIPRRVAFAADTEVKSSAIRAIGELNDPQVLIGAMSSAPRERELLWEVLTRSTKPVIVVPKAARRQPFAIARALVPLDETSESAQAIEEAVDLLARAGVEIVVLHVLDPQRTPPFWNHAGHADNAWKEEFLARYCRRLPDVRVVLRSGLAEETIADVARDEHVDLVALAWSQHLDEGRSKIIRSAVCNVPVPVLLVPVP